jgi:protein subunit release factor A
MSQKQDKQLLFSLTKNNFEFQTFCTGGAGGQHRNAKQNGVRCIHYASGSVAEHRDGRDQAKNKEQAFIKCASTKEFKAWHRMEVARRLGNSIDESIMTNEDILKKVDAMMAPENLKIEYF